MARYSKQECAIQLNPYLTFNGRCEAAFKFYEKVLGSKIEAMMTYGSSPMAEQTSPEWRNKIMHARLNVGDKMLTASDVPPDRYEAMKGIMVTLGIDDPERPNAYSTHYQKAGRYRCRFRRPSGPFASACWSINLEHCGW